MDQAEGSFSERALALQTPLSCDLSGTDPAFGSASSTLRKWIARFPHSVEPAIFTDLSLLFLLTTEKYRVLRSSNHFFRLCLSLHFIQKRLIHNVTCFANQRHFEIRWTTSALFFPNGIKHVLGCIIGYNTLDRHELFDEQNVILTLHKFLPDVRLVEESFYCHASQHKNLKLFYFEIEQKNGGSFSLEQREIIKKTVQERIQASIQSLAPSLFIRLNEEEHYKLILTLSQEIRSLKDPSQAYITLEQQTGKEVIFRVILVYISPFPNFSLKKYFFNCLFVSERVTTVKQIDNYRLEAHVFCLHIPRDVSLLRSDGSLDFYVARQRVVGLIQSAIGDFRDYNGGIIIQQQDLLKALRSAFASIYARDPELLETFFYAITPIERLILLRQETINSLFKHFLEQRRHKLSKEVSYQLAIHTQMNEVFVTIVAEHPSFRLEINEVLHRAAQRPLDIAYAFLDGEGQSYFASVFLDQRERVVESVVQELRRVLDRWQKKRKQYRVLRIGMENGIVSLDPRLGGDTKSSCVLQLLFEGLTRFTRDGVVENGLAESINISQDLKTYTFTLRSSLWNDGTYVTAYDFEYSWKKILSPHFNTTFAHHFFPIKNAKEARAGGVSIGVRALDQNTLKVELSTPTPYFLELTALPIYAPVHRTIDVQNPQWVHQEGKHYPCNGPFQLNINNSQQGYQLTKNSFYWDSKYICIDQISMTFMSPLQMIQSFKKGGLDWVGSPFGDWHPFFHHGNEDKVVSFGSSIVNLCIFNTASKAVKHPKMRQACAYAIQRARIVDNTFFPLVPAYSPLLPHLRESAEVLFPEYNPEASLLLFSEVGAEKLPPLRLVFQENGIREYLAECLRQQFKECLGIECILEPLSRYMFFDTLIRGDFHIALLPWTSLMEDPSYTLNIFKSAENRINFSRWENASYCKALDVRERLINPLQRSEALLKAEGILREEMPVIPICYQPAYALVSNESFINRRMTTSARNVSWPTVGLAVREEA
jgi:oligopeptide transport system substrate-binding protein